jgi:hypothetical protein
VRDSNMAMAQAQWAPGGGRITGLLRYSNTMDFFEGSGFRYATSLTHQLLLDVSWKWLPKTAVFLQAFQGYVTYLNQPTMGPAKSSSYPLHAVVGLRGLITPKTSLMASLGYANAFDQSGTSTSGFFGSSYVDLQAIFTPSLLNRVTVGYHQDFVNSVISSFYYDYSVYASYVQQVAGRLAVDLSARLSHRTYEGLLFDPTSSRSDNVLTAGATMDYFIRNWAYVGAGYSLAADLTDYHVPGAGGMPGAGAAVSYTKHQVFVRLGITY